MRAWTSRKLWRKSVLSATGLFDELFEQENISELLDHGVEAC